MTTRDPNVLNAGSEGAAERTVRRQNLVRQLEALNRNLKRVGGTPPVDLDAVEAFTSDELEQAVEATKQSLLAFARASAEASR